MDQKEYLSSIFGLNGKTILITGASGGIGSAISKGVAQAGAEVALCGHTLSKCQDLSREIREMGGQAAAFHLDVADMDSIRKCVSEVIQHYGKIDVLFNVAGINKREGLLDVEEETYDRIMDTNLKGVFFVSQAVAREMYKRKSGNIINIGSHNDEGMLGGCSVYGAAKSGVVIISTYGSSYGNYVTIAHSDGSRTMYAHQSQRAVSAGQTVSQGEVIGYVGSTGSSTGNHLHFELWLNSSSSSRVNPVAYCF